MNNSVYLLWANHWGVYLKCTCPDPMAFPSYFYKKYDIPSERFDTAFSRLLVVQGELENKKIIPTKKNHIDIFPKLEDLIN